MLLRAIMVKLTCPSKRLLKDCIALGRQQFQPLRLPRLWGAILVAWLLWLAAAIQSPAALALAQIKVYDVSYHDCPAEIAAGAVTSGGTLMAANCFLVTGKTQNNSGRTVYDADLFGRIYDANGDPILQNRTRLGAIPEVPAGEGTFELRISVAANQPTPLKLEQFKAVGFSSKVRR